MNYKQKPLIGIIGGKGKMGRFFVSFFSNLGFSVIISDLDTPLSNKEVAEKADIVIVSVPIGETVKAIEKIRDFVKLNSLLCDITSLKTEPVKAMEKAKSGVLGMHPLFGPLVQNLNGQKIVFCRKRDNHWVNFLKNIFLQNGAEIIEISPKEHDHQMALIQALIHFININLVRTIISQKISSQNYFLTPVSRLQSLVFGRILAQNPRLYAKIEMENPFLLEILAEFEKNFKDLAKDVKKKDLKGFIEKFKKASLFLKDFLSVSEIKTNEVLKIIERQPIRWGSGRKIELKKENLKIGYLGPEGTFSFFASQKIFSKKSKFLPYPTIREVFEAVNNEEVDFGVVPAENSISGIVPETIKFLIEYPLKVSGSFNLKISHCLLARTKNKREIKIIKTHPQAFSQVKKWIEKNLPNVSFEERLSTVEPILKNKEKKVGFIGNEILAKKYNLYILAKNIEEEKNNFTKFYLISKEENKEIERKLKARKTLILLGVYNRVGILRDILDVFAKNNLNLTALHSLPSRLKPWDYFFFLEVEIFPQSFLLKKVLKKIEIYCPIIRVIGAS